MREVGRIKIYSILLLALLIDVTVLGRFRIFGAIPDLMMICVTFFGLFLGRAAALECGIAAGVLTDLFSLDYFGINTIVYGASGYLAGSMSTSFVKESRRTQALIVLSCTAFSMCLHFLAASVLSRSVGLGFFEYLKVRVLPTSIYTAALSIPVFIKFISIFDMRPEEDLL